MRRPIVFALAALALGAGPAQAAPQSVSAAGNAFTGGLAFAPPHVAVSVGETVTWTNTDFLVPHTSTEKNGLWALSGSYGGTPANPPGYAPGVSVARAFDAGTHEYFCEVHPRQMIGSVTVPVSLSVRPATVAAPGPIPGLDAGAAAKDKKKSKNKKKKRRKKRKRGKKRTRPAPSVVQRGIVRAAWAPGPPAEGRSYDVEIRPAGVEIWQPYRTGTRDAAGIFYIGPGQTWEVRARLTDGRSATGWSPPASVSL